MNDITTAREFGLLVRTEFAFLEADDGPNPDFNVMDTYYEGVFSKSYPWIRTSGYWNVFLNLDVIWDPRDSHFTITVRPNDRKRPSPGRESPFVHIDWILDVLNPGWRDNWPAVDPNDGIALVKLYAAAIKPYAREIFIPAVRPSEGFEGFSWWSQVKPRVEAAQPSRQPKTES